MDLSYIAGFFDGEGSISLHANTVSKGVVVVIQIVQQNYDVLEEIATILDAGHITTQRSGVYVWSVYNRDDVERVLSLLLPLLVVKKRQAELAIKYIQLRRESQHVDRHGFREPELLVAKQFLEETGRMNQPTYAFVVDRLNLCRKF